MRNKQASKNAVRSSNRSGVQRSSDGSVALARETLSNNVITQATTDPHRLQPTDVLQLQRTVGNRAMTRMLVQPQLEVGPAGDTYEMEADRIAEHVVRSQSIPAAAQKGGKGIQRVPVIQRIQRNAPVGAEGGQLDAKHEAALRGSQNGGTSLPNNVRSTLEPKLGADLSSVKIHTDAKAAQLSRDMGAKAFTHKNHIYYGAGQSPSNLKLTAHEAVHTIQQGAVVQRKPKKNISSGRGTIQREYIPTGTEDPLNDYAEGDMSLFYGMEAPGDFRNKTLARRDDNQKKNKYPTIDSINRDVGINAEMGKGTSATGIFKVRQALADPTHWDTYFPKAVDDWDTTPQLSQWIQTLVANAHQIGLLDYSDSTKVGIWGFRKRAGKKKLGKKDRLSKNIAADKRKDINKDKIYNWLSMAPATGVNYNYNNLPPGVTQQSYTAISEWIYRAFFRRTSKLGLTFATNVLKQKVYFNTGGSVGYDGSFGSGTKQKGGIKTVSDTEDQSKQRAITVSEFRYVTKMIQQGKIDPSKVHFYDEYM